MENSIPKISEADLHDLAFKVLDIPEERCRLIEVSSISGHDAFLTEGEMFKPIIEQILMEA